MNQIKKLFVLLIVSALVACSQTPNGNDAPPLFIMEQPTSGDHSFINFSVDEIKILGGTGDPIGMGEFRLLIIGSDTDGRSSGTYCPGNEPIKFRTGDVISSPCLFTVGFDENKVGDGVFLMVIVVDEDESSLGADLTYEIITNKLSEALGQAIGKNILKVGTKSTPITIAASILLSFTAGKVKSWVEKADLIGVQGVFLSRSDNWSADKQTTVTSADSGIQFSYTITRSTTNQPTLPVPPTKNPPTQIPPTQPPATSAPTPRPTDKPALSDPSDFAYWYFNSLWTDRDYQTIWNTYLTPSFQSHASPGGYKEFTDWWDSVNKIDINSIDVIENDGQSAWIRVNVTFYLKDGRTLNNRTYDYDLTYNNNKNTWMFDYHY